METVELSTWEEFEEHANKIIDEFEKRKNEHKACVSSPLFRGQANTNWKLDTTLERYYQADVSQDMYYKYIFSAARLIQTIQGKRWELIDPNQIKNNEFYDSLPGHEFMVYLRHHGFPSPLLDWTRSPYIAAFFAFHNSELIQNTSVSIFSYQEYTGHSKIGSIKNPTIFSIGPFMATHKRHFIQQCEYTYCKTISEKKKIYFDNHENALKRKDSYQDKLIKFIIPKNEKDKVLRKLDRMNINIYSLFENEEALMEIVADRVFHY